MCASDLLQPGKTLTLAFGSTEGKSLTYTEGEKLVLHIYSTSKGGGMLLRGLHIQRDREEPTQLSVNIRDIQHAS